MALLDERLDHANHRTNLFGGARTHVGVHHVGAMHHVDELIRELRCHLFGRPPLLVGAVDDLIVHVGEVLRKRDLVATCNQPAANHVEADERARVANVDVVVDGGAAHVHADLALLDGLEVFLLVRAAVVDLHGWNPSGEVCWIRPALGQS